MKAVFLLTLLSLIAPVVFAEVGISGLAGKSKDNVRLVLSLEKEKCDAPEWKIRGLYAQADQEIDRSLRALGYYHAVIDKSLAFGKTCWKADFTINPGPQVYVKDINVTFTGDAHDDAEFKKLHDKLLKTAGSPLDHSQYEKMKRRIESLAQSRSRKLSLMI